MKKVICSLIFSALLIPFAAQANLNEVTIKVAQVTFEGGAMCTTINNERIEITDPNHVIEKTIRPVIMVRYQEITVRQVDGKWVIVKFNCVC